MDKYRYLEELSQVLFSEVSFTDRKVLEAFDSTGGIPEFESEFVRNLLRESAPSSFYDLIQIPGLAHGTGVWEENGQQLAGRGMPVSRIIAYRDDIFNYIQKRMEDKNISGTGYACQIMEEAARGTYAGNGMPAEIGRQLFQLGAEEWFTESLEKFRYLFPRAQGVLRVKYALILMWYKINCPEAFHQCGLCNL